MKITDEYKNPFGPVPSTRLFLVPRWSIISMSHRQSVAEHSYNVVQLLRWMIDERIVKALTILSLQLIEEALDHDVSEHATGDLPSPCKLSVDETPMSWPVKLADLIEAHRFALRYCDDAAEVRVWVLSELKMSIYKILESQDISYTKIAPIMEY